MFFWFKKNYKVLLPLVLVLAILSYFFLGASQPAKNISWGLNFSQKYAQDLGLDWKEVYTSYLDDLQAKKIKIAAHWDILEPQNKKFYFDDLSWQLDELAKRQGQAIVVVGMKTTRWPECHIPTWAASSTKEVQQEAILGLLQETVNKFKDHSALGYWQVENEPLFSFGQCPWSDREFLKKEIELVRSLDKSHPIVFADSGEWSPWFTAAQYGDVVSTTMYRRAWFKEVKRYFDYPLPPVFYQRKSALIAWLFHKPVICGELQAEPWGAKTLNKVPYDAQMESMNLQGLQDNLTFARNSGFDTIYLWGGEWMYWAKTQQQDDRFWEETRKLFRQK